MICCQQHRDSGHFLETLKLCFLELKIVCPNELLKYVFYFHYIGSREILGDGYQPIKLNAHMEPRKSLQDNLEQIRPSKYLHGSNLLDKMCLI